MLWFPLLFEAFMRLVEFLQAMSVSLLIHDFLGVEAVSLRDKEGSLTHLLRQFEVIIYKSIIWKHLINHISYNCRRHPSSFH